MSITHSRSWRSHSHSPPKLRRPEICQSPCCKARKTPSALPNSVVTGKTDLFHVFEIIGLRLAAVDTLPDRQVWSCALALRRRRPGRRSVSALLLVGLRGRARTGKSARLFHPVEQSPYLNADSKSSSNPKPLSVLPCVCWTGAAGLARPKLSSNPGSCGAPKPEGALLVDTGGAIAGC